MEVSRAVKGKARVENVLLKQHIVKRKKLFSANKISIGTIKLSFVIVFIVLLGLSLFKITRSLTFQLSMSPPSSSVVHFDGAFTEDQKEKITKDLQNLTAKTSNIETLASTIQETYGLDQVHVFKNTKQQITISIVPRVPIMQVIAGKPRILSVNGEVYNDTGMNFGEALTVLSGVFSEDHGAFLLDEKNCIATSDEEKRNIKNALNLYLLAKTHSLQLSTIEFVSQRGFITKLLHAPTTILFGNPPFEKKFTRVLKILDDSRKKGTSISNIEIDFGDKAFVTQSKA